MYIPIFWCGAGNWSGFSEVTHRLTICRKMRESSLSVWNEVIYLYEFQPSGTVYKIGAGYMENPFGRGGSGSSHSKHAQLSGTVRKNEMITRQFCCRKDGRYTDGVCMAVRDGDYANALFR